MSWNNSGVRQISVVRSSTLSVVRFCMDAERSVVKVESYPGGSIRLRQLSGTALVAESSSLEKSSSGRRPHRFIRSWVLIERKHGRRILIGFARLVLLTRATLIKWICFALPYAVECAKNAEKFQQSHHSTNNWSFAFVWTLHSSSSKVSDLIGSLLCDEDSRKKAVNSQLVL